MRSFSHEFAGSGKMPEPLVAVVVIVLGVLGVCWWLSDQWSRSRKVYERYIEMTQQEVARHEQSVARYEAAQPLYARSIELTEEGNRLKAEEIGLLRELIAALRERQ